MNQKTKQLNKFQAETFYDQIFSNLDLIELKLEDKIFEDCRFERCDFRDSEFIGCEFVECEFDELNLSNTIVNKTSFNNVCFRNSKLIGINWARANWSSIKVAPCIEIIHSDISYSSFYGLYLSDIIIEQSKIWEVDFREADISSGCFAGSDFLNSLFGNTIMRSADFRKAINYSISLLDNDAKKSKFSMPEAVDLLQHFDIQIDDN